MMMPSIFGENLFDSFFDDSFPFFYNDRDLKKDGEEALWPQG